MRGFLFSKSPLKVYIFCALIEKYGSFDNIPDSEYKKTLDSYNKEEFEKRNQY